MNNDQRKQEMWQKLINSTIAQVNLRGTSLTTQDICEDAGVGKGSLFRHFKSKNEALQAAFEYCVAHCMALTQVDAREDIPFETLIRERLAKSILWAKEYPQEVLYCSNYNALTMLNPLMTSYAEQLDSNVFLQTDLQTLLWKLLPDHLPHDYIITSVSTQVYQLTLYLAQNPEQLSNEAFIRSASDSIWNYLNHLISGR